MREVLERITPTRKEYEEVGKVSSELLSSIRDEASTVDRKIEPLLVGSISRDTWLGHEKDIDIFLRFPEEYSRSKLEEVVTEIGKKLLEKPEKRYAEHPYIKGRFAGHMVEIVPCYDIDDASKLKSAVDRTPFHDEFVRANLDDGKSDVRLLKQFLKGIGCYGAETSVEGFSGYLCEILVIKYGSFEEVLKAASKWSYGTLIDLQDGGKGAEFEDSPLVFIDPVDRKRNVAKALSTQCFYTFIQAANEFLKGPRIEFFFPEKRKHDGKELLERYRKRGTGLLVLSFRAPDVIEDILYPQVRKAQKALLGLLNRNDFSVVGADFEVADRAALLFELKSLTIPEAKVHLGPPVNSAHEGRFLEKYEGFKDKLCEPFIDSGKWQIILKREHANAQDFLEAFLKQEGLAEKGIPSHVARAIEKGFAIKTGEDAFEDANLALLGGYLDPKFPWEGS